MRSIAQFCYRRRRLVVAGWVLLVVGLFALSGAVGGEYRTEFKLPGSESPFKKGLIAGWKMDKEENDTQREQASPRTKAALAGEPYSR